MYGEQKKKDSRTRVRGWETKENKRGRRGYSTTATVRWTGASRIVAGAERNVDHR